MPSRTSSRGVTGACSMGANTSLPLEDNRPPAYCLTRRRVSLQEDGWGADPRRVKRETARPHPIAFGSVVAGSTRDSWSEIRSEEHTSELQSQSNIVCRLLLEKKKQIID